MFAFLLMLFGAAFLLLVIPAMLLGAMAKSFPAPVLRTNALEDITAIFQADRRMPAHNFG